MKKTTLFSILCSLLFLGANAQVTTPNTGVRWNLDSLVSHFPAVFSLDTGFYNQKDENLLIAENDTLLLENSLYWLVDSGLQINVEGTFISKGGPGGQPIVIIPTDTSSSFEGFRFEDSSHVHFSRTVIQGSGGLRVLTANFHMDNCQVSYSHKGASPSGVLSFSRGKPVVINSTFARNEQPAIASGANQEVSAYIKGNLFGANNLENSNRPQINLGPTHPDDTTYIIGNLILGDSTLTEVGGVSVSSLLGMDVNAVIDSNYIGNNRYGITLYGASSAMIRYNDIIDNDVEPDPMSGGSGISIYQNSGPVVATGNTISGNLWGVTLISNATINLGDTSAASYNEGKNVFSNNGNGGVTYALYNNTANPIMALNNCWTGDSTATLADAENVIFHMVDDGSLGEVFFDPMWDCTEEVSLEEEVVKESLSLYPNPTNGAVHIDLEQPARLGVYSLTGMKVAERELDAGDNYVDLKLEAGVYIFKVEEGKTVRTERVVVK